MTCVSSDVALDVEWVLESDKCSRREGDLTPTDAVGSVTGGDTENSGNRLEGEYGVTLVSGLSLAPVVDGLLWGIGCLDCAWMANLTFFADCRKPAEACGSPMDDCFSPDEGAGDNLESEKFAS